MEFLTQFSSENIDDTVRNLDEALLSKNRMSAYEFERYAPLFQKDILDKMSPDRITKLMDEYSHRVSLVRPVEILLPGSDDEVWFTLPPMFKALKLLNSITDNSDTIMNAFHNAMGMASDPLALAPYEMTQTMSQCVTQILGADQEQLQQIENLHNKALQDLKENDLLNPDAIVEDAKTNTFDMEWEDE